MRAPYLPREGAFGEMVLNVGKVVYLAKKGAAGIIDISPFTCMNGIVCEAIYPRISRDLGGIADPQLLLRRHAVRPGSRPRRLYGTGSQLSAQTPLKAARTGDLREGSLHRRSGGAPIAPGLAQAAVSGL